MMPFSSRPRGAHRRQALVFALTASLALAACGVRPSGRTLLGATGGGAPDQNATQVTPGGVRATVGGQTRRPGDSVSQAGPAPVVFPAKPYYVQDLDATAYSTAGLSQYLDLSRIALASSTARPGQEVEIDGVPLGAGKIRVFFTGSDGVPRQGFIRAVGSTSIALVAPVPAGAAGDRFQVVVSVRGKFSSPLPLSVSGLAPAAQPLSTTDGQITSAFSQQAAGTALAGLTSYISGGAAAQAIAQAEGGTGGSGSAETSVQDTAEQILESSGFTQALSIYLADHDAPAQSVQALGCSTLPYDPLTKTSYSLADIRCGVPFYDAHVGQDAAQFQTVSEALQRAMAAAQSAGAGVLGQVGQTALDLGLAEASWQIALGAIPTQAASFSVTVPDDGNYTLTRGETLSWSAPTVQYSSSGSWLDLDQLVSSAFSGFEVPGKAELLDAISAALLSNLGQVSPNRETVDAGQRVYFFEPQTFPVDLTGHTTGFLAPPSTPEATPAIALDGGAAFTLEATGSAMLRIISSGLPDAEFGVAVPVTVTGLQPTPTPSPSPSPSSDASTFRADLSCSPEASSFQYVGATNTGTTGEIAVYINVSSTGGQAADNALVTMPGVVSFAVFPQEKWLSTTQALFTSGSGLDAIGVILYVRNPPLANCATPTPGP